MPSLKRLRYRAEEDWGHSDLRSDAFALYIPKPESRDVKQGRGSAATLFVGSLFVWYGFWYGHHEDHDHA